MLDTAYKWEGYLYNKQIKLEEKKKEVLLSQIHRNGTEAEETEL